MTGSNMKFSKQLLKGKILKRYKRFFADLELEGQLITAHCPNTGTLKSCWEPGRRAYVSQSDNPDRKLKYTLELTEAPTGALVGINTGWPNKLVREIFDQRLLTHWKSFHTYQGEVKISKETRLDARLEGNQGLQRYVEIKNVTLVEGSTAYFPDTETTRGQKHLKELIALRHLGHDAEIVFVIQRSDCTVFKPSRQLDPKYSDLLMEASKEGVTITPLVVDVTPTELQVRPQPIPWELE